MHTGEVIAFMSRWYDAKTNAYMEWIFGDEHQVARDLALAVSLKSGMCVLDVGCNVGQLSLFLAREFDCHAVGVDASRVAIETAQCRAQQDPPPKPAIFHMADARTMPFETGEFDAVISKDTLVNIMPKAQVMAELHRVLKPGGRLAFTDWMRGNPVSTGAFSAWMAFKKEEPFDMVSFSGYEQLLQDAGFESVQVVDRGEAFRQLFEERYAALQAADPAEIERFFGVTDPQYFVQRFGLTHDVIMAQDVIWGQASAQRRS